MYIEREADRSAAQSLDPRLMNYIALIEPGQQGKSSLIGRLMKKFSYAQGYCWAYVNLSRWMELVQPADWYAAIQSRILKQIQGRYPDSFQTLDLPRNNLVLADFFEALAKRAAAANLRLVIACDEASTVPKQCVYSFFQSTRVIYNARMTQRECGYLSFIIASASDLAFTQDFSTSNPLNAFQNIEIGDFTLDGVQELVEHLPNLATEDKKTVAERLFFWVDGHPFLTQWLCAALFEEKYPSVAAVRLVDRAVQTLRQSSVLSWRNVVRMLDDYPDLCRVLQDILVGEKVPFHPGAGLGIKRLKLMGCIKADTENCCKIRNRLYRDLFEQLPALRTKTGRKGSSTKVDRVRVRITATQNMLDEIEEWFEDGVLELDEYLRLRYKYIIKLERHRYKLDRLQPFPPEPSISEVDLILERSKSLEVISVSEPISNDMAELPLAAVQSEPITGEMAEFPPAVVQDELPAIEEKFEDDAPAEDSHSIQLRLLRYITRYSAGLIESKTSITAAGLESIRLGLGSIRETIAGDMTEVFRPFWLDSMKESITSGAAESPLTSPDILGKSSTGYSSRRLPIYLLLSVSDFMPESRAHELGEELEKGLFHRFLAAIWRIFRRKTAKKMPESSKMSGFPQELPASLSEVLLGAVNQIVSWLCNELMGDPDAIEKVWLSVITFGDNAQQVVPLTALTQFNPPTPSPGRGRALGAALRLLNESLDRDIVPDMPGRKGDRKAIIFLMTDGVPTDIDVWEREVSALKNRTEDIAGIVALASGDATDQCTQNALKQLADVVLTLDFLTPSVIAEYLQWTTQLVGSAKLPLPPDSIQIAL